MIFVLVILAFTAVSFALGYFFGAEEGYKGVMQAVEQEREIGYRRLQSVIYELAEKKPAKQKEGLKRVK